MDEGANTMRVPLSWLKEYVDIILPIDKLVQRLTLGGLEVEEVERIGVEGSELPWDEDKIFVANIVEVKPHPNADRLVLADVEYGAEQPHTVVTGAPNIFEYRGKGRLTHPLKSVFAKEGSRLYDGHQEGKVISTLKARPVRGVMSDAMLCSKRVGHERRARGHFVAARRCTYWYATTRIPWRGRVRHRIDAQHVALPFDRRHGA